MVNTDSIAYPLNVYAKLLELSSGAVDYLHFGVFGSNELSVTAAQENATEILFRALPGPCNVLEVGIGLGTTLARLGATGYNALGITPDPQQAALALQRYKDRVKIKVSRLEDFRCDEGDWNLLLFQESGQYIDPEAIFDAASRLLSGNRPSIILMDEFCLREHKIDDVAPLHLLEGFCALASRRGWQLTTHQDLSDSVRPTLDFLISGISENLTRLAQEVKVEASILEGLLEAIRRHKEMYLQGTFGYALLRFEQPQSRDQVLWLKDESDGFRMRELFERTFGKSMSEPHWQWKYGQGRGQAVALFRDGVMLGHYGGVSRDICFFGKRERACQICDVMVDPRSREGLNRRGPIVQMTQVFLDAQVGVDREHLVGFGFPNQRAFRVAERAKLYASVDQMVEIRWQAEPCQLRIASQEIRAEDLLTDGRLRNWVDQVWRQMADEFCNSVICVRDSSWILHRYLRHPENEYQVVLIQSPWLRRPLGLFIARRQEKHLELLDLVAPKSEFKLLISAARQRAFDWQLEAVKCWVTDSHLKSLVSLDDAGHEVASLGIVIPTNIFTPGPVNELQGRWFLMAGDADFT